jgi:hypothetical protein
MGGGEPFLKTLNRATIAAALLGLILLMAVPRHGTFLGDFIDVFIVAFCFTFLAPYIDVFLRALPGIDVGPGRLVRLAGWFAGGLWCYLIGRWLWIKFGRELNDLPRLIWGGVFLVIYELVMNSVTRREDAKS